MVDNVRTSIRKVSTKFFENIRTILKQVFYEIPDYEVHGNCRRHRATLLLPNVINFVAMREFKVCLSVGLNICLGYKSRKNSSILTKFAYVFRVKNFRLCTKNCIHMLDNF